MFVLRDGENIILEKEKENISYIRGTTLKIILVITKIYSILGEKAS